MLDKLFGRVFRKDVYKKGWMSTFRFIFYLIMTFSTVMVFTGTLVLFFFIIDGFWQGIVILILMWTWFIILLGLDSYHRKNFSKSVCGNEAACGRTFYSRKKGVVKCPYCKISSNLTNPISSKVAGIIQS